MTLRSALDRAGASQGELASHLGLAKSTVSQLVTKGQFPKKGAGEIRRKVNAFLLDRGVSPQGLWAKAPVPEGSKRPDIENKEENIMISKEAKKQFKIARDPFAADVASQRDVYMTSEARFAAEYMYTTARSGGLLAVIGESGSGKTTLRRLLIDRVNKEELKIKVVFPRIIDKGRLSAASICDAIISDCSQETPKKSLEAKARQIERILKDSLNAGWKHVLMIEEAHDLTIQTLKYLKRFWELESGFEKLLSIILIAQPELKEKLDESRNWEAREIIRRMEIVELGALQTAAELKGYLEFKLRRVGLSPEDLLEDDSYGAILNKLSRRTRRGELMALSYPLTVNNLIKRALNTAAEVGQEMVNAETIGALQ